MQLSDAILRAKVCSQNMGTGNLEQKILKVSVLLQILAETKRGAFVANTNEETDNGDFMQRRFTERRVNANVEWCFVIGQCHGNGARFDVGVDATCASNVPIDEVFFL